MVVFEMYTKSFQWAKNLWVSIEKCETEIPINKGLTSLPIKRTNEQKKSISIHQAFSTLALTFSVYKFQVLSLEQGVINFDLRKQKSFWTVSRKSSPGRKPHKGLRLGLGLG